MSYTPKTEAIRITGSDFRSKMRNLLDEKVRLGRDGIDRNMDKKGYPKDLFYRNHSMPDAVFELGVKIHEQNEKLDYRQWIHWMVDSEIKHYSESVVIYHRSEFFCEYANKHLGEILWEYFRKPIEYIPSREINEKVEA